MLTKEVIYRVIDRRDDNIRRFDRAESIAVFMLSKHIDEFLIVKSDSEGDRIIEIKDDEYTSMMATLLESEF